MEKNYLVALLAKMCAYQLRNSLILSPPEQIIKDTTILGITSVLTQKLL